MSAILNFLRGHVPVNVTSVDLSPEARALLEIPLHEQVLLDRPVSVGESVSLESLAEVSSDVAAFKTYFPSVEDWMDVMGCLPSEAFIDKTYHDLFNGDYRKLKAEKTWPGIINSHDYPTLKLLPLENLLELKRKDLTVLDVPLLGLPKNLGKMKGLKELVIHKTKVRCLPESIGRLALEEIAITQGRLIVLPDSIFKIEALNILNLEGNPLDNVTKDQSRIFNLKKGITVI